MSNATSEVKKKLQMLNNQRVKNKLTSELAARDSRSALNYTNALCIFIRLYHRELTDYIMRADALRARALRASSMFSTKTKKRKDLLCALDRAGFGVCKKNSTHKAII
uniref:Uncharacterized protein n=1 Tax=Trichogramma kaykai TaxID=54128 RepID=A0ABD2WQ86_9HYME